MNELSTKVKKTNPLQRLRLAYYRRKAAKDLDIDTLLELPEYVQNDWRVIKQLELRGVPESELRRIKPSIILQYIDDDEQFFMGYSPQEKYEILSSGIFNGVIRLSEQSRLKIVEEIITNGNYDIVSPKIGIINNKLLLDYYKESGQIDTVLPNILRFLDTENIESIIAQNRVMINYLTIDQQKEFVKSDNGLLGSLSAERQMAILEDNISLFRNASIDAKKLFIKNNPNMFMHIDEDSQIELVGHDARLYYALSYETEQRILTEYKEKKNSLNALIRMMRQNTKNMKLLGSDLDTPHEELYEAFKGLENESTEKIVQFVLHSKLGSAIGSLSSSQYALHGNNPESISGIDGYNKQQIEFFHRLNSEQMAQLVNIDVNYVLPYLTGEKIQTLSLDEREESQRRCEDLFCKMFGKDQCSKYLECMQLIYDMQLESNELIDKTYEKSREPAGGIKDYDTFKVGEKIPLEELKILFNRKIIETSTPEQIREYLLEKSRGNKADKQFSSIIERAYGEKAVTILESRPELNVHSINSLEVFDDKILETYGEAFVHDCISYNLRDFSEFLEAVKNPKLSKNFYEYYEILSNVFGRNVETMQRAMSEYSFVKDLIQSIGSNELSGKQAMNLIKVLCSRRNTFDINSVEELEHFDEIANKKLERDIKNVCANPRNQDDKLAAVRDIICENLLGMSCRKKANRSYGSDVETLTSLYDFGEDESIKKQYSEEERRFMKILDFLRNEKDINKLIEFARNTQELDILRNPVALNKVIDKVMENELEDLNEKITSIDEIQAVCDEEKGKQNPKSYYEEIDGLQVYHLTGMQFCFFQHDKGDISHKDFFQYEGQGSNSAICSRLRTSNMDVKESIKGHYIYGKLPPKSVIVMSDYDASTTHASKRVTSDARTGLSIKEISEIHNSGNEVAFYRRNRDHSMISNDNNGGRYRPMAYGISEYGLERMSKEEREQFIRNGIPIIVIHEEKYKEKESEQQIEQDSMESEI